MDLLILDILEKGTNPSVGSLDGDACCQADQTAVDQQHQQRQLSKFRMRYQQFAFHAYCGAAGSVYKMAPQQEKAFCVLRFEVSRSVITVQREFRAL